MSGSGSRSPHPEVLARLASVVPAGTTTGERSPIARVMGIVLCVITAVAVVLSATGVVFP